MTNTDDLNERCDDVYCIICGLPLAADHSPLGDFKFREFWNSEDDE